MSQGCCHLVQETEGKAAGERVMSQKEITLRDDLELRDRLDIYRNFLLYCMSGDVVTLPMGTQGTPNFLAVQVL